MFGARPVSNGETKLTTRYGITGISDRIKSLFNRELDENLLSRLSDNPTSSYDPNIFSQSSQNDLMLLREVPQMLKDGIIQSALALVMDTTFQTNQQNQIAWPVSKYNVIVKELNEFHKRIDINNFLLLLGFNLLLWGNLPHRNIFRNGILDRLTPIPDFTKVVPIIVSGRNLGFLFNNSYHYPYEFTFAQTSYYRNLGGIYKQNMVLSGLGAGFDEDPNDVGQVVNEFTYSPSYLMGVVRVWQQIQIVEQVLLLSRMDQASYYRIIAVNVGSRASAPAAIKELSFYRNLFKKVRRVSFDPAGMAGIGSGQNFEVIVPKNSEHGIEVTDIGGKLEIRSLRDLDVAYNKLFAGLRVQPQMLGFGSEHPNALGQTDALVQDSRFAKTCKSLMQSCLRAVKAIDLIRLQSLGYNVSEQDWSYGTISSSLIEDKTRQDILKTGLENLKGLQSILSSSQVAYDKKYLVESFLGQSLENAGIDLDRLFRSPESETQMTSPEESEDLFGGESGGEDSGLGSVFSSVERRSSFISSSKASALDELAFSGLLDRGSYLEATASLSTDKEYLVSGIASKYEHQTVPLTEVGNVFSNPIPLSTPVSANGYILKPDQDMIASAVYSIGKDQRVLVSVPVTFPVYYTGADSLSLTMADFDKGMVQAIRSASLLSNGSLYFDDREALVSYLSVFVNGGQSALIEKLNYPKKLF